MAYRNEVTGPASEEIQESITSISHRKVVSMHSQEPNSETQPSWFERPQNINLLIGGLVVICAGLVIADFFYENHHPHFEIEKTIGFQAWFGFVVFVAVVFLGRLLRIVVKRPEDYYDR